MNAARDVARALLGSWPNQVAQWGDKGLAAYLAEIEARGVTPDAALVAIRSYDGDFPPSAGRLAKLARQDPSLPSSDEVVVLLWGNGGAMHARDRAGSWPSPFAHELADEKAILARARELHPMLGAYIEHCGVAGLRLRYPHDPKYGELNRKTIVEGWRDFCATTERRQVAELVGGRHWEALPERTGT